MTDRSRSEARIIALIAAYADRAPIDVDPMAMTRLAATATTQRAWVWTGFARTERGLAFLLLVVALLVSILAGGLVAGGMIRREPDGTLTQRGFVEPFVGLPPEGATPSAPETGELVFSFGGRVNDHGGDFHRMWVYADGRLIWKSNLEGSSAWRKLAFGTSQPTTAVIEQRLTPEGVALMRAEVMATVRILGPVGAGEDVTEWHRPGVIWGGMTVGAGAELFDATWADPQLPGRLANPASWLPANAWQDQRIGAYVPSRHAVCIEPPGLLDLLPDSTRELIRSRAGGIDRPAAHSEDIRCPYRVTTEDARAITATLDDAGLEQQSFLRYHIPIDAARDPGWIEILPIVPHGEVVCDCG